MAITFKELKFYMINKVDISGIDTSKLPVLKEKELTRLLLSMKNGNTESRQLIIMGNLKLVLSVIQRFNNKGKEADDLFQIGCMGLIKSIDNFDLSYNLKFSTYAVPMIIGEIRRYLRDNNSIKVSRTLKDIAYRALQARDKLLLENNKEPTIIQIAKELNIPKEEVVFALDTLQEPVSIFEPVNNGNNDATLIMDQISDNKISDEHWLENIAIKEGMKKLNDKEKLILTLRFFEGKTQMEVSKEIGISQAQISRMEKNALLRMRKYI